MSDHPLVDLTAFGFTPTEGLVYGVLLRDGPGTGYAIARGAGLARANAYSALEGLVTKGAARAEGDRPKVYRPEPPAALVARIADSNGAALERLSDALHEIASPATTADVELTTARGALQVISHDVARAARLVAMLAPPDAYSLLLPALRRPAAANIQLRLASTAPHEIPFADVQTVPTPVGWPGEPIIVVVDDRTCVLAARTGGDVLGHWSTSPVLVAAARTVLRATGMEL
jgi:sugar-specific transcriptional regulator TrmB